MEIPRRQNTCEESQMKLHVLDWVRACHIITAFLSYPKHGDCWPLKWFAHRFILLHILKAHASSSINWIAILFPNDLGYDAYFKYKIAGLLLK